jgi:hypothetical protein
VASAATLAYKSNWPFGCLLGQPLADVVTRSSLRIRPRSRREILEGHWPSSRAAVDMVQPSVVRICRKSVLSGAAWGFASLKR